MSIIGRVAMVRNAKQRMVDDVESPIGGETLDREKLPVSKFLRNPHLTVNTFVVHDTSHVQIRPAVPYVAVIPIHGNEEFGGNLERTRVFAFIPGFFFVAKIISPMTLQSSH
jgi:hypothetical protein